MMKNLILYLTLIVSISIFSQKKYEVKNIDINNDYPHYGLSLNDNSIIFTSYQIAKNGKVKKSGGEPILMSFIANNSNGNLNNVEQILIDEKEDIKFINSAALSPDGKYLFVATDYINRKNKPKGEYRITNFHIEIAEYKYGIGWTNFKVLPFCKPRYSYAHPFVSKDGKTLYFTTNVRGGKQSTKGASDIFKVDILGDNTYGELINLGSKVNSYSKEMYPFISNDNVLYFSSNRPNGFGGFDIYESKMLEDGTFEKAIILPKPINSKKDDISLIMDINGNGYFSSRRIGGKGEDDIYYFTIID